jgi:hypothetical protein
MSITKEIKSRLILKHDTADNWNKAGLNGFCPLANEIIMFDPDESCTMIRYKIGRWANTEKTELININNLPFENDIAVFEASQIMHRELLLSNILDTYIFDIDYDTSLAFNTSEIVIGATSTTSVLGQAILGQMVLA